MPVRNTGYYSQYFRPYGYRNVQLKCILYSEEIYKQHQLIILIFRPQTILGISKFPHKKYLYIIEENYLSNMSQFIYLYLTYFSRNIIDKWYSLLYLIKNTAVEPNCYTNVDALPAKILTNKCIFLVLYYKGSFRILRTEGNK